MSLTRLRQLLDELHEEARARGIPRAVIDRIDDVHAAIQAVEEARAAELLAKHARQKLDSGLVVDARPPTPQVGSVGSHADTEVAL